MQRVRHAGRHARGVPHHRHRRMLIGAPPGRSEMTSIWSLMRLAQLRQWTAHAMSGPRNPLFARLGIA